MNHGCSASKSLNHRSVFQIEHLTICISFLVPQFSKFSKRWTMFNGVIILRTKTGKFNGPNELPKCSRDSNDSAVISKEFKSAHKILIVWYFELLSMEFVSIFWSFSNGKDDFFSGARWHSTQQHSFDDRWPIRCHLLNEPLFVSCRMKSLFW